MSVILEGSSAGFSAGPDKIQRLSGTHHGRTPVKPGQSPRHVLRREPRLAAASLTVKPNIKGISFGPLVWALTFFKGR